MKKQNLLKSRSNSTVIGSSVTVVGFAQSGITPHNLSVVGKAEDQRFKSFPRNFILKLKDYIKDKELLSATAANYRIGRDWKILVFLNKIHKNCRHRGCAERINNLYTVELICAIMRNNTDGEVPPCELEEFSYERGCVCRFPMHEGMGVILK